MFDQFLAQILIFSLIAISCTRIFFIDKERIDSLAILPTMAFWVSLFTIFIFGINIVTFFAFLLSVFCCATNLRSFLRLRAQLIVDHYNPGFIFFSVLELLLALGALTLLVLFRPVRFDEKNLEKLTVSEKKIEMNVSYLKGSTPKQKTLELKTSDFYIFKPNFTVEGESAIVLFVPGDLSSVNDYESYLAMLAQKGFTVVSADFYSDEFGFFGSKILDSRFLAKSMTNFVYFLDKKTFNEQKAKNAEKVAKKYEMLYDFVRNGWSDFSGTEKIFIVMDDASDNEKEIIFEKFDGKVSAYFAIENVAEYKTSGFGFIEQTNPMIAKTFNLSRDKTFFIPRYVANKTAQEFELFKFPREPQQ